MASFNKVILMGNLTRDPEVRYTTGGTAVCDITLAINHNYTDKRSNERREEVSFIDITLWGRTAEIAGEYLAKGRPVLIEGRLQQDKWDDKETGQKRSKLKVVADGFGDFLQLLDAADFEGRQLFAVLFDHPLILLGGHSGLALWQQVVASVTGLNADDVAAFAEVFDVVNEQYFDVA